MPLSLEFPYFFPCFFGVNLAISEAVGANHFKPCLLASALPDTFTGSRRFQGCITACVARCVMLGSFARTMSMISDKTEICLGV